MEIKNIIFDFGGVVINIDHQRVERAFLELGISDFEKMFNQAVQSELFQNLERGRIDPVQFRNKIREITGLKISNHQLDDTWNQIIGDYPPKRIDLLKTIGHNYRLFILSNTNSIHFDYYIENFRSQFGFDFLSLFENTYWSFQIGKRKPDPESYLHVIEQNSLIGSETLFIDDSIQNVLAAQDVDLKAYLLKPDVDVTDLFENGKLVDSLFNNV